MREKNLNYLSHLNDEERQAFYNEVGTIPSSVIDQIASLNYYERQAILSQYPVARKPTENLLDFIVTVSPTYIPEAAHSLICSTLDSVVRKDINRVIITAPPQSGKSHVTSVHFPAFFLGKRPNDPIILTSYGADLAEDKSKQVRAIIEDVDYARIFPETKIRQDSRAVNLWHLEKYRGCMLSAGAGGPITGHGGLLGLIDDPFENWKKAQNQNVRNEVWEWYRGTFRTRVWESAAIVIMMCMTGDTPVLMPDGTELPLRDIKIGDKVATYDNGKLETTLVQNHKSNGNDLVYKIIMADGRTIRANERHPFLVEENDGFKWIRLKYLTTSNKIVTHRTGTPYFKSIQIDSIEPDGIEEVFDIQIERTGNFIANGLVSHNTRWNEDDLVGRLLNSPGASEWTILRLPALAEEQSKRDINNKAYNITKGQPDPLGRSTGEPLTPRRFSRPAMEEIKRDVGPMVWNAEYQGAPTAPEGNTIKREWFERKVPYVPSVNTVYRVRYWDKAATEGDGDYTVGLLMCYDDSTNTTYIEDVVRGQWNTARRDNIMEDTAESDEEKYGNTVAIWHEQEPGSGGKDSAVLTDQRLRRFIVSHVKSSGNKSVRAEPFIQHASAGNVMIVTGKWNEEYIDELCAFPFGEHDDQVDATSGAYNRLALKKPKKKMQAH